MTMLIPLKTFDRLLVKVRGLVWLFIISIRCYWISTTWHISLLTTPRRYYTACLRIWYGIYLVVKICIQYEFIFLSKDYFDNNIESDFFRKFSNFEGCHCIVRLHTVVRSRHVTRFSQWKRRILIWGWISGKINNPRSLAWYYRIDSYQ